MERLHCTGVARRGVQWRKLPQLYLSPNAYERSHRVRSHDVIADLRLATQYLKELAALRIAEEAEFETDPARKLQLKEEAAQLHILGPLRR
jgi:hypothetical protein